MWWTRSLILAALALVLGIPFLVRAPAAGTDADADAARTLIAVTPHVEQIRNEFGWAFDAWHRRVHGEPARIDWRAVGGTSEIVKQLEAQYTAAIRNGTIRVDEAGRATAPRGAVGFDVMIGGGSFDHGRLKRGVTVRLDGGGEGGAGSGTNQGREVRVSMSTPAGFPQDKLDTWYGPNTIGAQHLYDPDQHWLGTALSGFGIVFNRDVLRELGLDEPRAFRDLADPRYVGLLALADSRQSGSVATTYESILNKEGWDEGWRILRDLSANARYFATSSVRPPIDVSQGDAAAGLAIDFYGRGQAQVVMRPGETPETCRVGYVDPQGAVYIDADPVSILLGGPDPELARRFVEFCLSEEGQALWQMHATSGPLGAGNPIGEGGKPLGPRENELRRMPVRRVMYGKYVQYFVDKDNPFELAADVTPMGWRDAIGVLMGAFGIDTSDELREAWIVLTAARRDPAFPPETLAEMERAFYAMPEHVLQSGERVTLSKATYKAISDDTGRWRDPQRGARAKIAYTEFFRRQYTKVAELGRSALRN